VIIALCVAIVAAGLFAGAAVYINLVEHPARLELGTEVAVREFGPSYRRAAVMQASLALLGLTAGIAAWISERDPRTLVAALLLGSVVPFTLVVVAPTNRRLLDPELDPASPDARLLLVRWGRLHAVRSVLGLAALLLFVTVLF